MAARLYAPEIARVLADPATNLGVDPRYGQDNWRIARLKVTTAPGPHGEVLVTARFWDLGKPARVRWRLGVQSRGQVDGIEPEAIWLVCPGLADGFVGCEAA
jgi:hypothetical protein